MTVEPTVSKANFRNSRELFFRESVWLNGLHAGLEIVGGVALLMVSRGVIIRVVAPLTQDELAEDPHERTGTGGRNEAE
jgi:uncharacterized membrane protein